LSHLITDDEWEEYQALKRTIRISEPAEEPVVETPKPRRSRKVEDAAEA
jgi:hypothetical protein